MSVQEHFFDIIFFLIFVLAFESVSYAMYLEVENFFDTFFSAAIQI